MTVAKLLQTIKLLPQEAQQKLTEFYEIIDILYKKHGSRLTSQATMKAIAAESQDLADLINETKDTIGLESVHELRIDLQKQTHVVTVSAPKEASERLTEKLKNTTIKSQTTDQLGIKIKSNQGKEYSRSIDKDLSKLTR